MKITLSKSQWEFIGKKAGWIDKCRKCKEPESDIEGLCEICKKCSLCCECDTFED